MGKKAQMFIVTAVFLSSTLFFLQQALVTYASIDSTKAFRAKEVFILKNVQDSVTTTIRNADDNLAGCQDFQKNLDELISLLEDDVSSEGFVLELGYQVDCSRWLQTTGAPPLLLNVRLSETYDIDGNVLKFYHLPVTDEDICQIAEDDGLCDGLDIAYPPGGYKSGCCVQHGLCC